MSSKKPKVFEDFIGDTAQAGNRFSRKLEKISAFRSDLESDQYRNTVEAQKFRAARAELAKQIVKSMEGIS